MGQLISLVGERFGRLVVCTRAPNAKGKKPHWICRCDCGNTHIVSSGNLRHGSTKSCGCLSRIRKLKDLRGQVFGRLTVRHESENSGSPVRWDCKCECGEIKSIRAGDLKSKATRSCGCLTRDGGRYLDIAGEKYGMLTAISVAGKTEAGQYRWHCECECGERKIVSSGNLRTGEVQSCGCLLKIVRQQRVPDLTGRTFGRWTVVKRAAAGARGKTRWVCNCACGTTGKVVPGSHLVNRRSRSCGCYAKEKAGEHTFIDLTGEAYGRLTVRNRAENNRHGQTRWNVECKCGKPFQVLGSSLKCGETTSCGCLQRELSSERGVKRLRNGRAYRRVWPYRCDETEIMMRSSWEVAYAHYLDSQNITWTYEPRVFKLSPTIRYVPDFYIESEDLWVEIKGRMTETSAKKITEFKKKYRLVVIRRKEIEALTGHSVREMPKIYPNLDMEAALRGHTPDKLEANGSGRKVFD